MLDVEWKIDLRVVVSLGINIPDTRRNAQCIAQSQEQIAGLLLALP
jgi:hypothetical protein